MIDRERLKAGIRRAVAAGLQQPALQRLDPQTRMVSIHTLDDASIAYAPLIDAETVHRRYPDYHIQTDERMVERMERHGLTIQSHNAGMVSIRRGRVHMPQSVCGSRRQFIEETYLTSIHRPKDVLAAHLMAGPATHHGTEAVLLSLMGFGNYYHWTAEILPRLQMIESDPRWSSLPIAVPKSAPPFVRRSVELAVNADRILELSNGGHSFDVLHVPTALARREQIAPAAVRWLRKTYVDAHAPAGNRRVYVSRRDAPTRFVVNEPEVEAFLADYGFETVSLTGMSFEQQVETFANASLIAGSHGAGFVNAAFSAPGATLIELFSPQFVSICYWSLCNACGHKYGYVLGQDSGLGLRVDLDPLRQVLEMAMADTPAAGASI